MSFDFVPAIGSPSRAMMMLFPFISNYLVCFRRSHHKQYV